MTTIPPTRQDQPPSLEVAWGERPSLVGAMFNPALIACLLAHTADGYSRSTSCGMPWMLSYLAAPLVLHRGARETLPPTARSMHLAAWVRVHPILRAGFPLRARDMVAPVRAGLRFSLRHEVLHLVEDRLHAHRHTVSPGTEQAELDSILNHARSVGRWLSTVDTATAFSLLGVAP